MRRIGYLASLLVALAAAPAAAQTITSPSTVTPVASANDFATTILQDPWDMNQRTDIGWFVNSVDYPLAGFSSVNFANGLFTGTVSADPNLWLLEGAFMGAAPVGKFGINSPINANVYRIASMRLCVPTSNYMLFFWSTHSMFDPPGLQISNAVTTTAGCRFYFIDLAKLGLISGTEQWSGFKRSLRLDPAPDNEPAGGAITLDWVRLSDNQPSLVRDITWSGFSGNVDVYLDNNNQGTSDPNQTLGLVASNVSGSSYPLNVGALQPGNYYVAIRKSGTSGSFAYSSGYFQVNAPPTLTVTSPSNEGSADDFATVHLNNPWDFTSMSDIDHLINVQQAGIVTVPNAENEAGAALGNITAFAGANTPGVSSPDPCQSYAKPAVYPFHPAVRGQTRRIDPTRYRILTAELGLPNKARDICNGSIVRIVWQVAGESAETYSDDIVLNSRAGGNVVSRLNIDMATLAIEPGSPSQTGWVPGVSPNPGISSFRIDPDEFMSPTSFFIKRMKLAALDNAHTSFDVQWTTSKTGGQISVYYDTDKDPVNKSFIATVNASALTGSLSWNTSGLPDGAQYYVYIEQNDGTNSNGTYSRWPIVIDHTPATTTRLVLNRSTLNFGVVAQTIKTPSQTLRLSVLNAPAGQPCWTASSDLPFLVVSPASGCGGASLTVSLVNQNYPWIGDYAGSIRISSPDAVNSPQFVQSFVRIRTTSTPPSGAVDTPANGAIVSGSLAVTGWAIDDIGVARVTICRSPISGEAAPTNGSCGPNQLYVGDAVSIEDARPDIEGFSPNSPLNYRAGWGFLVLTNMLPNQGNGTFTFHLWAFDQEGQGGALGSRTVVAQNSAATEPFGAIDTPGQGETISGTNYANFGWVLSRTRRADPPGGGAVFVFIDGVAVGSPGGWARRADLAALFPNYPGINTALGVFSFNTLSLANGLHTIVWVVTDNVGVTGGVGSRFFSVFNAGNGLTASAGTAMRPAGPDLGRRADELGGRIVADAVGMRGGFGLTTPLRNAGLGVDGMRRVSAVERDRVEIRIDPSGQAKGDYAGYLVVDGQLRELPNGSSFDPSRGAFYWQPGLGYVGNYDLLFVRKGADGVQERIPVRVSVQDRPMTSLASKLGGPWATVRFE